MASGADQRTAEQPAAGGAAHQAAAHDAPLSACIIAGNEADRIGPCLASVAFCDEIVVVLDARCDDGTRELAEAAGARVLVHEWPGFLGQKQRAVDAASHDWVLCLDADERVSDRLRGEIESLRAAGFAGVAGGSMPRLSAYLGAWMRHGSWYPDRIVRLFDRRRGRWAGGDPHPAPQVDGPVRALKGDLLHHPYRSFGDHLRKIDEYTTVMAERMAAQGKRAGVSDLLFRPAMRFVRFYLLDLGFLCGWRGLLLAFLAAHYGRMKYAKLMVLRRAQGGQPARDGDPIEPPAG